MSASVELAGTMIRLLIPNPQVVTRDSLNQDRSSDWTKSSIAKVGTLIPFIGAFIQAFAGATQVSDICTRVDQQRGIDLLDLRNQYLAIGAVRGLLEVAGIIAIIVLSVSGITSVELVGLVMAACLLSVLAYAQVNYRTINQFVLQSSLNGQDLLGQVIL